MSTNPTDWFQHFYQPNSAAAPPPSSTTISNDNSTPPTTNSFISFSDQLGLAVSGPGPSGTASTSHQPNPGQGGRVSKPARRRHRASKKTQTTLLNTDTANFRSMVQRYTGGPSAYAPPPGQGQGQGQFGNFNSPGTWPFVPAPVDDLPQQILQQYGASTNVSSSSSIGFFSQLNHHHVGPAGGSADHSSSLGGGGGSGGGGGENERSGFMF